MVRSFHKIALGAACFSFLIGSLVILGWMCANPFLKSILPELRPMNPLTACLFMLSGTALFMLLKSASGKVLFIPDLIALVLIFAGLWMYCDYMYELPVHIDQLLWRDDLHSNRMGRGTSLNFILAGLSLFMIRREAKRKVRLAEILNFITLIFSLFALFGYLYSVNAYYPLEVHFLMAFHTALTFFVLTLGIFCLYPRYGLMELFSGNEIGSRMARKCIVLAITVPALLGYLRHSGEQAGLYNKEFGICLMVVSTIVTFILLIGWNAWSLNKSGREKKKIQEELRLSRDYYHNILDEIPTMVWKANLKAEKVYFNKSWLEFTGHTLEAQLDFGWMENIHPDDRMLLLKKYLVAFDKEMPFENEYRFKRFDGVYRWILAKGRPIYDLEKKFIGYLGTCDDITEKKLHELKMQEARMAAENANTLKSRFLANMSHEIRTPLNAIIGFADVLGKETLNREQQQEYLEYITSSGKILLKLIGDVLDISKIEEGKVEIVKESFYFREVISSSIVPYKYKANEQGLEFDLEFDPAIPDFLTGDRYRINQVLINLIGNALKFTREGKIAVRISNLTANPEADEAVLKFEVSDTGIGIPVSKQDKMFESFTQADNSIVREFGGSGLGLSIVKQLVSLMGGTIGIESPCRIDGAKGGPGTCFSFVIRLAVDKSKVKQPLITAGIKTGTLHVKPGVKILVVEDNAINQRLAKVVLRKIGCDAVFASNGQEAIDKIETENYTLVLMDVQMPVMDGIAATREIRKNKKTALPIIGLTANVFKEDIENCLNAGMNDYLGKPYTDEQLCSIINKWAV